MRFRWAMAIGCVYLLSLVGCSNTAAQSAKEITRINVDAGFRVPENSEMLYHGLNERDDSEVWHFKCPPGSTPIDGPFDQETAGDDFFRLLEQLSGITIPRSHLEKARFYGWKANGLWRGTLANTADATYVRIERFK